MFSLRSDFDLRRNRFAALLDEVRRDGDGDRGPVIDLTESNPTGCGFTRPGEAALAALVEARVLAYSPHPLGMPEAREAVARHYAGRGDHIDAGRIVLAASTSEAYSYLFKLLADDGDQVLVPRPSYPLLDFLARLEGVRLCPYRLEYERGWHVDLDSVRDALTDRTRAVLVVSPNNPTGNRLGGDELAELAELAGDRGVALVVDEVFADFPFVPRTDHPAAAAAVGARALTFSLSGISKVCGLPQLKLAWAALGGPAAAVEAALSRLEVIADTYLSVGTPVQIALPRLLAAGAGFRAECLGRIRANLAAIARRLASEPSVSLLAGDGGWYACLRVPRLGGEEELVLDLLREDRVAVHPGYFFDFPSEAYLVVSLIVPEEQLRAGLERILARVTGRARGARGAD